MPLRTAVALLAIPACAAAWDGAGLSEPFQFPDNPRPDGVVRSVLEFGARPGDEADDSTAINAAIAASQPGDTVFLPDGAYRLTTTVALKGGVSVRGQSRDGVLLGAWLAEEGNAMAAPAGAGNMVLSHFTIHKAGGAGGMHTALIIGEIRSTTITARVVVEHLVVRDFESRGITLRSTRHGLVRHCLVGDASKFDTGGQGYGIEIGGKFDLTEDMSQYSNNNWLYCNEVRRIASNEHPRAVRHGILLQYWTNHNLIEGNTIREAMLDAFDLHGENEHHNEFRFNTVIDGGESGFGVGNPCKTCDHDDTGDYNWIHHNTIVGTQTGVEITLGTSHTLVEANTVRDLVPRNAKTRGIHIVEQSRLNPGELNDGNVLRGNVIHGAERGIELSDAPNTVVEDNAIFDNKGEGILVGANSPGWIARNNVVACNGSGIVFDAANKPALIEGNRTDCEPRPTPLPVWPSPCEASVNATP